jgi:hypothetical protein
MHKTSSNRKTQPRCWLDQEKKKEPTKNTNIVREQGQKRKTPMKKDERKETAMLETASRSSKKKKFVNTLP